MTKYLALFCALSAGAFAGVDGTVVNRTTGKPQPGATVTLYKLGQAGPEALETVKSGTEGKFQMKQDLPPGPNLIGTAYDGVVYNRMLTPGSSGSGVEVVVYNSSSRPGTAQVSQHMVLLEPATGQVSVGETFFLKNAGNLTYNDPKNGTLRFYLPKEAEGKSRVMAQEPDGMPLERAAEKTNQAGVYMLDFPIKPGETRIDISYVAPLPETGTFSGRSLYKGGPTRLVVPNGVTLEGSGLEPLGQEPTTQAAIYGIKDTDYTVQIKGTGSMRAAAEEAGDDSGPSIQQILPKTYDNLPMILIPAFAALALGFALLYRKGAKI